MPIHHRRLLKGALLTICLIVAATMLRLAFEWRQALANIDAMIVTPVAISIPTEASLVGEPQPADQVATSVSIPVATPVAELLAPTPVDEPTPNLSQAMLTILLLGTDRRPNDTEVTRTDALMLVRIDRDRQQVSILSIPRDLWVNYAGGGEGRINAAYALGERRFGPGGGAAIAKSTVEQLLDINVDHFVLLNFQGFQEIIEQIGGIKIDIPEAIYDPSYPTEDYGTMEVRFEAGPQLLDAERALIYARTRHADNDFGRNQRQQLVLMAIFNRIRERGLLHQLTNLDDYTGAMRNYMQTDLSRRRMLELADFARGISNDDILRYAINSRAIVDLSPPATFAADPQALIGIMRQFTGEAVSSAGGS
jgi:LCP family protein required for cell wall assembly